MIDIVVDIFMEVTGLRRWSRNVGTKIGREWGEKIGDHIVKQADAAGLPVDADQPSTSSVQAHDGWYEIPRNKKELDAKLHEQKQKLAELQIAVGDRHVSLAPILDYIAALLKADKQLLEAANCRARANAIRAEHAMSGIASDLEINPSAYKTKSYLYSLPRLGRPVTLLVAVLVGMTCIGIAATFSTPKRQSHDNLQLHYSTDFPLRQAAGSLVAADFIRCINEESPGTVLDLPTVLASDKESIVYFHSSHCPSCEQMMPLVAKLAAVRPDLNMVAVNIDRRDAVDIDFESPLADQFEIHGVPAFKVYDKRKNLVAEGEDAKTMVRGLMREANVAI